MNLDQEEMVWLVFIHQDIVRILNSFRQINITGMLISGAIGGLAGTVIVLGNTRNFYQEMAFNQGFDGILIAIIGKLEPLGGLISSLLCRFKKWWFIC